MKLKDFTLEIFFQKHAFSAPYLLAQSDCASMSVKELLAYEPGAEEGLLDSWLGYTPVAGSLYLREVIAGLYESITPEDIMVHVGAQEPIFNFMNVLLEKGDHVICQFPAYQSFLEVPRAIGCEVSKWEMEQGETGWVADFDKLESMITPKTKLLCLNSPHNPTGYAFTKSQMDIIVAMARKHDLFVFYDEVYKGLELDGVERPWFADCYEKGVSLGVLSKAYGMAGLRLGWIATKDSSLMKKMEKMKHYTTICTASPSEYLSMIALKHSQEVLDKNKKIIESNMKLSHVFFNKYNRLFQYNPPMAGPIAFHKMNIEMPIDEFCETMIAEKGVLLLPASIYEFPGQYFRMGYGRKNFGECLSKFEEYLMEKKYV